MSYSHPDPDVRVSQAERDEVVAVLATHYADGRLTMGEYEERCDAALAARTGRDFEPLFADLPSGPVAPAASGFDAGWRTPPSRSSSPSRATPVDAPVPASPRPARTSSGDRWDRLDHRARSGGPSVRVVAVVAVIALAVTVAPWALWLLWPVLAFGRHGGGHGFGACGSGRRHHLRTATPVDADPEDAYTRRL
jgi:hypothetical protein